MTEPTSQTSGLETNRWINPTSLAMFVLLIVVVIFFIATIDWNSDLGNQNNFTVADVSVAPVNDPRLIRSHTPVFGNSDAPVKIVEFSDFECPFCGEAFPVVRSLLNKHGDSIQYAYRHFPVESIHPNARLAAEASQCAHEQNKFLPFHDRLFLNQDTLGETDLLNFAQQSGLNLTDFSTCLSTGKYANAVQQDLADGVALGVRATPTWFINGRKVEGAIPEELFFEVVESVIAEAN